MPYTVVGYDQTFSAGPQTMDGSQVLGYSRTRHSLPLGDFDRSLNQGVVLKSALTQFRVEYAKDAEPHVHLARRRPAQHRDDGVRSTS